MTKKVLFVCLGNICRSPTAHGVFEKKLAEQRLSHSIEVDSAGTGDWHIGEPPDARAIRAAAQRGYDLSMQRARQIQRSDFAEFDYIIAMDGENVRNLMRLCPREYHHKIDLLLNYGSHPHRYVPDPYYGSEEDFNEVVDLVEAATDALLAHIRD